MNTPLRHRRSLGLAACTAALVLASSSLTHAANFTTNTVGTVNGNTRTLNDDTVATNTSTTGVIVTSTTFASDIATAFTGNTGGVWNFDTASFNVANNETVTLSYGTSQASSLVLTMTEAGAGVGGINQGTDATTAASGSSFMGLGGTGSSTRTFTLNTPLLELGLISLNRNDGTRFGSLTVTFQDNTSASTTSVAGTAYYFHGFKTTADNPIVSFTLTQTGGAMRYDDLGFVVSAIPEPSTYGIAAGGLALVGAMVARRRRANAAKA